MIQAILWIAIKFIDLTQTYSLVSVVGMEEGEANPFFVQMIYTIGWAGAILGTIVIGAMIWSLLHISNIIGGKIKSFVGAFVWVYVLINFVNITRSFMIATNLYPAILP